MEYDDLARAATERGEVMLRQRRDPDCPGAAVVELRVNGVFVMDTAETASERGLAAVALAQVAQPRAVLVGGLGLGFTAHEVLGDPRVERVVVVEVEEPLVAWMRDGTVPDGPSLLADERLHLVVTDIRTALAEAHPASYDLVLLDVDNGPDHLVHPANAAVYEREVLTRVREVLRPGGALVVWSMELSAALDAAMTGVFGAATPVPYDVRLQERDERYWVYLARRPPAPIDG